MHKKIVFMVYLVGMLIESIPRDGPAGPEHCQWFSADAGEFYKQRKKW